MLIENGINLKKKVAFPDHYEFVEDEIKKIINEASEENLVILTSEKDYFRIKKYSFKEIKYIKVRLKINDQDRFLEKINNSI